MLYKNVANEILDMLRAKGGCRIGDKIPNETKLAEKFQVGRNTIREAVRFLVLHNVLEIKRGKGTFVSSLEGVGNGDLPLADLSVIKIAVKDLYETRLAIEPQTAYYAAKRATEKELKRIEQLALHIQNNRNVATAGRIETEVDFHTAIARASKNQFMLKLIPVIRECIVKTLTYEYNEEITSITSLEDHKILVEFLMARDAEGARNAMSNHISRCMHHMNIKTD